MELLSYISDIFQNFIRIIRSMNYADILDIILLTILIYLVIKLMRDTRAEQLLKGVIVVVVIFVVVEICELKAMSFLIENFLQVGIIAIIVVFQPELRRILERVGRSKVTKIAFSSIEQSSDDKNSPRDKAIEGITEACDRLARSKTGAIIVIERETKLGDIIEKSSAMDLNAAPNPTLLCNIFYNKAPLHDGAVIIRNNLIYAAGCFLPNSQKQLDQGLGSRHRAGLGMSEVSDALVIIVSEERGTISIANEGQLTTDRNTEELRNILRQLMPGGVTKSKKPRRIIKKNTGKGAE